MPKKNRLTQISVIAIPDVAVSTLAGMLDVLRCFEILSIFESSVSVEDPFELEIVGENVGLLKTVNGLPVPVDRAMRDIETTDIIIIPSLLMTGLNWTKGRYPEVVSWMETMHERGAMVFSACSGTLLLAETGLLDHHTATLHWPFAKTFKENFPAVNLDLEKVLVTAGERDEIIMSGATTSWHDLVLNLVARYAGAAATQAIARHMLLEWHTDSQAPYMSFYPSRDHDDAIVHAAQEWLDSNFWVASPLAKMAARSGVSDRSFKRRFGKATGLTPIIYVQSLRIEEAKRRLERTSDQIDVISREVGYEDPAFFRRLFKRVTTITPGAYRRKFKLPESILPKKAGVGAQATGQPHAVSRGILTEQQTARAHSAREQEL
jgi:transcriptional regulator GlxA family with amidase domain